jgi:hypothetical protein
MTADEVMMVLAKRRGWGGAGAELQAGPCWPQTTLEIHPKAYYLSQCFFKKRSITLQFNFHLSHSYIFVIHNS